MLRTRKRSAPPSVSVGMSPPHVRMTDRVHAARVAAANRLAKAWRCSFRFNLTRDIARRYLATCPTKDRVLSMSFDALLVYLRESSLIKLTRICLWRMDWMCEVLHPDVRSKDPALVMNVRIFLSGFMAVHFPSNVFEDVSDLERNLVAVAAPMLETFEQMCVFMAGGTARSFRDLPVELTREFPRMLREYFAAFNAWKPRDEMRIANRIKHVLVALIHAQLNLSPDEPEDSEVRLELSSKVSSMRAKLIQACSNGNEILREFDKEMEASRLQMMDGREDILDEDYVEGMSLAMSRMGMTNEGLAHELLLDPQFQLDRQSGTVRRATPAMLRVRDKMHSFFWLSMEGDLKLNPPSYVRSIRIIEEVGHSMKELYAQREGEAAAIDETFDVEFIRQQVRERVFDWESCKRLIAAAMVIIRRNQAPHRDAEISAGWRELRDAMDEFSAWKDGAATVFCKALRFLLDAVCLLRIDAANARLRLISPIVSSNGVEYERRQFEEKLGAGKLTLERATAWIRKTLSVRHGEVSMGRLANGDVPAIHAAIDVAAMEIVADCEELLKESNCPEMLLLDEVHLRSLQADFQFIVTAATMLVRALHLLGSGNAAVVAEMGEALDGESVRMNMEKVVSILDADYLPLVIYH